ncbi:DUF308 domain-containing protein [Mycobacterium sp. pV006]|uniref:DUF308 domain-containing protein n=1 Tax=Mycobacterium sp. pV006 TaxID=3238983 RepID=UPI00351B54B9
MLIVALVLAVIGLVALVTAVVTSNELIAWVCIAASAIGVILLIVDALRDRSKPAAASDEVTEDDLDDREVEDYPDEAPIAADYTDEEPDVPATDGDRTEDETPKS